MERLKFSCANINMIDCLVRLLNDTKTRRYHRDGKLIDGLNLVFCGQLCFTDGLDPFRLFRVLICDFILHYLVFNCWKRYFLLSNYYRKKKKRKNLAVKKRFPLLLLSMYVCICVFFCVFVCLWPLYRRHRLT